MAVLVVEAYADLRAVIVETFAKWEVECDSAGSEEDAIRKLRSRSYDTIFIAPRLPIRSDPVVRFLCDSQPAELGKVVLMTDPGVEGDQAIERCRMLTKPFSDAQLFAKIHH